MWAWTKKTDTKQDDPDPHEYERLVLLKEMKHSLQATVDLFCTGLREDRMDESNEVVQLMVVWLDRCMWHGLKSEAKIRKSIGGKIGLVKEDNVTLWNVINLIPPSVRDTDKEMDSLIESVLVIKSHGWPEAWCAKVSLTHLACVFIYNS